MVCNLPGWVHEYALIYTYRRLWVEIPPMPPTSFPSRSFITIKHIISAVRCECCYRRFLPHDLKINGLWWYLRKWLDFRWEELHVASSSILRLWFGLLHWWTAHYSTHYMPSNILVWVDVEVSPARGFSSMFSLLPSFGVSLNSCLRSCHDSYIDSIQTLYLAICVSLTVFSSCLNSIWPTAVQALSYFSWVTWIWPHNASMLYFHADKTLNTYIMISCCSALRV